MPQGVAQVTHVQLSAAALHTRSADPTATHAGYEDPVLLAAAQGGDPQNFRLSPWLFTPGLSVAFPTKEWPLEYFTNGERGGKQ